LYLNWISCSSTLRQMCVNGSGAAADGVVGVAGVDAAAESPPPPDTLARITGVVGVDVAAAGTAVTSASGRSFFESSLSNTTMYVPLRELNEATVAASKLPSSRLACTASPTLNCTNEKQASVFSICTAHSQTTLASCLDSGGSGTANNDEDEPVDLDDFDIRTQLDRKK